MKPQHETSTSDGADYWKERMETVRHWDAPETRELLDGDDSWRSAQNEADALAKIADHVWVLASWIELNEDVAHSYAACANSSDVKCEDHGTGHEDKTLLAG
ncbi:hypothetical protein JDV02_010752 [Purpureocillium takamizusanense]|uniref:Uncharacterized protein n=1 Tax=Purpureocillium takamizusanense TaxID=2060973 RepID=A0A9Q8QPH4_9HYPO|nr:uncharacterized protein JDV02_010752 [Purpureocillium takamizusanense]UNI25044.1 hypothetical protein JDV02_010752 [Purpureocillium takamizusanense]